jgi:CHAT domain-containing protein
MPVSEVLSGNTARIAALEAALKRQPQIIHIAVHVVSPQARPEDAALAFSLGNDRLPELITREVIATYHVPGSLVVLSGCSSGQGRAVPSAGLIGLSRAWLLAGASAVLVSDWPTPDDSGPFFSTFYKHLQSLSEGPLGQRAATALRQAQLDTQRSGGYRSSTSFWAAYSVVSKE